MITPQIVYSKIDDFVGVDAWQYEEDSRPFSAASQQTADSQHNGALVLSAIGYCNVHIVMSLTWPL